jgi:hypothetical protein
MQPGTPASIQPIARPATAGSGPFFVVAVRSDGRTRVSDKRRNTRIADGTGSGKLNYLGHGSDAEDFIKGVFGLEVPVIYYSSLKSIL